ncbi:UDP-glycosyltransferase UGT5-like [Anticarsia gemmatalis]|uniref:UDP-glycosyltransferase UGT5-like n=1 Tax=Anticarsia gemmatalis TaxID=129554 RepID=UPI003F765620
MPLLPYFVFCYLLVVSPIESARILAYFQYPSISHQVVFRPITQELARRGHEVVVITADPAFPKGEAPANLTEIDVHDISYEIWRDTFMKQSRDQKDDVVAQTTTILESSVIIFEAQLRSKQVQELVQDKTQKFDLILIEACVRGPLVFSHIYNAPVILISSFAATLDNYEVVGAPTHPFLYPMIIRQKLNDVTVWDKVKEMYRLIMVLQAFLKLLPVEREMVARNFGSGMPSFDELNNNVHMLFLNINPIFEGIRPVPPTVVFMGGLHQKPEKDLPADLKSYLDSSKNGVIYVSFGTNVDPTKFSPDRIEVLVKTLSKLPYDVLWKWNDDELPGRTENIKISKWLPQSDLLRHPKIKLFVTQGGLQSTDEAITAGVPLIGMPMIGDQWFNVERYVSHKIGIRLDLETATVESFTNAINTIINDESYRRNIIKLRDIIQDEPMKPLDKSIWWIEYVLRHGGAKHLRSPAANISYFEYLELELVFTVLAILFAILAVIIIVLRAIFKIVIRQISGDKLKRA